MLRPKSESKNVFVEFLVLVGNLYTNIYLLLFKLIIFVVMPLVDPDLFYYEDLYPNIPMELGGVKTNQTILILSPSDFQEDVRVPLFKDSAGATTAPTDTLLVYFYNDSKLIFKLKKEVDKMAVMLPHSK